MRHNESKRVAQDELMSELESCQIPTYAEFRMTGRMILSEMPELLTQSVAVGEAVAAAAVAVAHGAIDQTHVERGAGTI